MAPNRYNLWKEPDPLPLYSVSNVAPYDFIRDAEEHNIEPGTGLSPFAGEGKGGEKRTRYINEPELVYDFMKTVRERRCSGGVGDRSRGRLEIGGGGSSSVSGARPFYIVQADALLGFRCISLLVGLVYLPPFASVLFAFEGLLCWVSLIGG